MILINHGNKVTFTATKCPPVTQVSGSVPVVTKCLVVPTGVPTGVVSDVQSQGILSGVVGVSASIGSVRAAALRASFVSTSVMIAPGVSVSVAGPVIAKAVGGAGVNAIVVSVSSALYKLTKTDKVQLLNNAINSTSSVIQGADGSATFVFTLDNSITSFWYQFSLSADSTSLVVEVYTGQVKLASVTFGVSAKAGKRDIQFTIVMGAAPVNSDAGNVIVTATKCPLATQIAGGVAVVSKCGTDVFFTTTSMMTTAPAPTTLSTTDSATTSTSSAVVSKTGILASSGEAMAAAAAAVYGAAVLMV
ncbi:hypothetical protein HDU99_005295 [Rhizoclosmatium hyalinum]|nr:hypothetical protein HDU99_005295 [Rhizoclosmatium hyalinum]